MHVGVGNFSIFTTNSFKCLDLDNGPILEDHVERCEQVLSKWATTPVVGILPGAIKITLGIVQTVAATIFVTFTFFPAVLQTDNEN